MMLAPLKDNPKRQATATVKWVPAPTRGWNARDDLTDMEPTDAITLDNVVVTERGCKLRNGYDEYVTGLGGAVQTLMEYSAPDGTRELFAATPDEIYKVTTPSTVDNQVALESGETLLLEDGTDVLLETDRDVVIGLSSGDWSHVMFATAGGTFLVACNGLDAVRNYDGTTWTTPTITGSGLLSSASFVSVNSHMSRLWFVQKNTMKVWYLPASSIAGTATAIDFGPISRLGGELVAMTSWSRDGGAGIDDIAVFITSKGELHVYSGTDPASADTWERVGTFKVAEPIGRRCFVKAGADVGILTSQGLVPLSNVLSIASTEVQRVAATEMIGAAFQTAYEGASGARGWQVLEYPKEALVIVNVPLIEGTTYHQYVLSVTRKAWSRFTDIPAQCWSLFGDRLFFGGTDGTVYEYRGTTDDGAEINATIVQAFNDLGSIRNKIAKRMRPQVVGPIGYRPAVGLRFDYDDTTFAFEASPYTVDGPAWDENDWDVTSWGPEERPPSQWQAVRGKGFVFAIVVQISIDNEITYNGTRIMFEEASAV